MDTRLVNVRLDPERLRKARRLREQGVTLSDMVREAIDARYDALRTAAGASDASALVRRLFERHPDPPDLPARDYDVHDRRAAGVAIRRALRKTGR